MLVASVFEKEISQKDKIDIVQKVYDNCWLSETVLFNAMSQIAEICSEQGSSCFEKISEIMELSVNSLEKSKQILLTNPDIYVIKDKKGSLAKDIKLARLSDKYDLARCKES